MASNEPANVDEPAWSLTQECSKGTEVVLVAAVAATAEVTVKPMSYCGSKVAGSICQCFRIVFFLYWIV